MNLFRHSAKAIIVKLSVLHGIVPLIAVMGSQHDYLYRWYLYTAQQKHAIQSDVTAL
jgi:hypothetical protein